MILGKPIVVTNFTTARDQIEDGQTGLIVNMDAKALADGIRRLIEEKGLAASLTRRLAELALGTESEVKKLYRIVGEGGCA
ncbi:Glycosyl transferases group 1 [compost metagenome]